MMMAVGEVTGIAHEETAWQRYGLCAQTDPEAFFPELGESVAAAKRVCFACPVRVECLDYALAHDERFGVWGGLSVNERRRLTGRRAKDAPPGSERTMRRASASVSE